MRTFLVVVCFCCFANYVSFAQTDAEKARAQLGKAIKLMDNGDIDESIAILRASEKLDPDNFIYPYEIAFAHVKKKDYNTAIAILKKTLKYDNINSQVYQMLGNAYSYSGNPKKAIKTYEKGMEKFPNAGNLHLEKGNIFWFEEDYNEAITNYENGIKADPMFASNYYRLALLYLQSTDKLSGLLYGEIFMNLERSTARTQEVSELLYNAYKESITIKDNEVSVDFCEIVLSIDDLNEDLTMPLCAIFAKNIALGTAGMTEVNPTTIANFRKAFIRSFFQEDYKEFSNALFDYQKKLYDAELFEVYSRYLIQMGDTENFGSWAKANEEKIEKFIEWYTKEENYLNITKENYFIKK